MPHCIIEYSNEIEKYIKPQRIIDAVYRGALKSELFEDDDIKTRSLAFENYQSGSAKKNFVHVTVKILSGRSIAQKRELTESIISQLEKIDLQSTLLTVDIVEMVRETYSRAKK